MKRNARIIQALLTRHDIHPVLVDIGASAGTPAIWNDLATHAIYIGFDPDQRDLQELSDGHYYKGTIVNKAVTSTPGQDQATFYFTNSPYCSSTLPPDNAALSNYLFANLFEVTSQGNVPTTTLDDVVAQLNLPCIDWFKTDSQGTDLRLFTSLNESTRSRVLAIDIEPGLIDAYQGEDLFVTAHSDLIQQGFWLSDMNVCGTQRIHQATLRKLLTDKAGITYGMLQQNIRKSPGWCEARYLRTLDWLKQHNLSQREYVLLWVFALVDNQIGYALDVALAYEQVFGKDTTAETMQQEVTSLIQRAARQMLLRPQTYIKLVKQLMPAQIKKPLKRLLKR